MVSLFCTLCLWLGYFLPQHHLGIDEFTYSNNTVNDVRYQYEVGVANNNTINISKKILTERNGPSTSSTFSPEKPPVCSMWICPKTSMRIMM